MRLVVLPRSMKDGNIRLRPLRIFDGPAMHTALRDRNILEANGLSTPLNKSWWWIWWWFKTTFFLSYCIEIDSAASGFIGLCNSKPGRDAEMSLLLFDKTIRRRGYGSRSVAMVVQLLKAHPLIEKIMVRVQSNNGAALHFWKKLGFEEIYTQGGTITLCKNVGSALNEQVPKR